MSGFRPINVAVALAAVTIHPSAVLRAGDEGEEAFDGLAADLRLVAEALA